MNVDLLYAYLIDFTWIFLGSWVALLLTAGAVAFADWKWPQSLPGIETWRRN